MKTKAEVMKNLAKVRNVKITIQRPAHMEDSMGGRKPGFADDCTVWAEKRKPSLKTLQIVGTVVSEMISELDIRYHAGVKKGWQVEIGQKEFPVIHVYSYGTESTIIVIKEVVK